MTEGKKIKQKGIKKTIAESHLAEIFLTDCHKDEMYYAALVRSTSSYGKITNIILENLPENYYLYTAHDIPGKNTITTLNTDTKIFNTGTVHYIGEPVGIIVGPDKDTVCSLAKEVQITFDAEVIENAVKEIAEKYKHSILNFNEESVIQEGVSIFSKVFDIDKMLERHINYEKFYQTAYNASFHSEYIENKADSEVIAERTIRTGIFTLPKNRRSIQKKIDTFYEEADFDISGNWKQEEQIAEWAENSGAFCYEENDKIIILSKTLWPQHVKKSLAHALEIDEEKIIVKKTLIQNATSNGIWRSTTLAVQAAIACHLCGHPVKLMLSKEEQKKFMTVGLDTAITFRSAVNKEGKISAMKINIDMDAGYVNPFAKEIADRSAIAAVSFYNIENLYICSRIRTSKKAPTSIYPDLIESQIFFGLENHIHQICEKTDILPSVLRMQNIETNIKEIKSPFLIKLSKPQEAMDAIIKQSDFNRKYSSFRLNSKQNTDFGIATEFNLPRRGIGLSTAYSGSFFYGSILDTFNHKMEVCLEAQGKLRITASIPSHTICEIWKKIASGILGIEENDIIIETDIQNADSTVPENFYSNISIMTLLLRKCCQEIQKKRFRTPLPITSKKSVTPAMKKQWNKETFSGSPFHTETFGTAIVEVEIDANTYSEKINGIWVAIDCGEILSIEAAKNAVRLAIQQELEHLIKRKTVECSSITISFFKSPNVPSQLGQIVHSLIPAAFTSALSLALNSTINVSPCEEEAFYKLTYGKTKKQTQIKEKTEESNSNSTYTEEEEEK